jgi:hypothetical protein
MYELYSHPFPFIQRSPIVFRDFTSAGGATNQTITPSAQALTLTLQVPGVKYGGSVFPSAQALALALQDPVIKYGFTTFPDAQALTLVLQAPTVKYGCTVSPDTLALLLSQQTPSVKYDYKVALGSALALSLALLDPTVGLFVSATVNPATLALTLTLPASSVVYDYKVAASPLALTLSALSPSLFYDYVMQIGAALGMTVSVVAPTVSTATGRTYIVCSSTDPAVLDLYIGGILVAKFTSA